MLVSDEEINMVWGNANFGDVPRRQVIESAVLKCASGYHQGYTSQCIARDLGLINKKSYTLTKKGKKFLWESWSVKQKYNV